MDFGVLPPEVVSARIYAGPGGASLAAAARGWSTLAAELSAAVREFDAVISTLTGDGWSGAAAEAMAARAVAYSTWLTVTAGSAEQAAGRCAAAASAFAEVFAAVVPPPVIAANRSALGSLLASNTFGQNGAAIAALESGYSAMWAQDQLAMSRYAARSVSAVTVPAFTRPPGGAGGIGPGQFAAGAHLAAGGGHEQLANLLNAIPQALGQLGSSPGLPGAPLAGGIEPLQGAALPSLSNLVSPVEAVARSVLPANDTNISILYGQGQFGRNLNFDLDAAEARATAATNTTSRSGGRSIVAGSVGDATTVGRLTVPTKWAELAPAGPGAMVLAAAETPVAGIAAGAPAGLVADMMLAGLAGGAIASAAAPDGPATDPNRLQRLAGELTGEAQVRHWHAGADPAQLFGELARQPGVHTVHLDPQRPRRG